MCMVRGCFLTILRREQSCFLHTEPLLEAQSCCRAGLQQQTLPFPRPTLLHTASQNVTTLARVLIELEWLACVCVHAEARGGTKRNDKQQNLREETPPPLFLNRRSPPTLSALTCRGGQGARFYTSELQKSNNFTALTQLLKTECAS